jgi:adenosylmethionine-8-amino-7-oxononanoate aminotransferase
MTTTGSFDPRPADPRDYAGRVMIDFTGLKAFADDPLILTEGSGVRVRDTSDRWFLDGLSGTFCLSLGHGNERLVEAGSRQLARLAMAAPTLAVSDRSLELAQVLLGLLPARYTTLKWGSGGSEAIEAAIKMARQYHKLSGQAGRYKVLSHYRGYHGVTGQALAATGWPHIRAPYEPLAGGFVHLHTPDPYRPPFASPPDQVAESYARLVEETVTLEGPETIAALMIEPVMMSAGVVVPPAGYLARLRQICDRHGILLIFDEIITGFGRVGAMFAAEQVETWPDILVLGKGISGGYAPLSATVLSDRLAAVFRGDEAVFQAGHTYAGNPVACAIALAAIAETQARDLPGRARANGAQVMARLHRLQNRFPAIGDVRGKGLMIGLELVRDRATRERFPAEERIALRIRDAARRRGLLVRASHWMIAFAPPLTAEPDELSEMLDILEQAMAEVLPGGAD